MTDDTNETERARDRRDRRMLDEKITRLARAVLREAGWNAGLPELSAAAVLNDMVTPERMDLLLRRAMELKDDPAALGRRLSKEEIAQVRGKVPVEKREPIREYIRTRIAQDAGLSVQPDRIRREVQVRFEVMINEENFYLSYWIPAGGVRPRKRAAREASPATASSPPAPSPSLPSAGTRAVVVRAQLEDGSVFLGETFELVIPEGARMLDFAVVVLSAVKAAAVKVAAA